jgi:hypothetical protein
VKAQLLEFGIVAVDFLHVFHLVLLFIRHMREYFIRFSYHFLALLPQYTELSGCFVGLHLLLLPHFLCLIFFLNFSEFVGVSITVPMLVLRGHGWQQLGSLFRLIAGSKLVGFRENFLLLAGPVKPVCVFSDGGG